MSYQKYINSEFSALTLDQVLREAPSVLIGVTDKARHALTKLNVHTVFDLGMSEIFDNAARILHGSRKPNSVFRKFGRAPRAMVDKNMVTVTEVTKLPYESIQVLIGIGPNNGPPLEEHLSVFTVRDLAMWPPYLAAKKIVLEAYNPNIELQSDPEAPAELIPKSGEYGTERYLYSSLVMFPGSFHSKPRPLNSYLFDITATPQTGFDHVRFGALLTYSQTWFPMRVAKGQLLHSLPLAPGESTRVAVIDWSNKSSAAMRESLTETEKLSNTNERARSITEIANTVANEFQSGSSQTTSESATASVGGIGAIPFLAGIVTAGGSVSETAATTHTVSSGSRDISTHLSQNIQDSTQQVASSVRGQRASVVSEVSQSQSEHLSTRTVTNYNHMHALTIQYYEVVQINETQVRVEDYERCIFVPIQLIDFLDERNIIKYLPILRSVALDYATKDMLEDLAESGETYELKFMPEFERVPSVDRSGGGFGGLSDSFDVLIQTAEAERIRQQLFMKYFILDHNEFIDFKGDLDRFGLNFELQLNNLKWKTTGSSRIEKVEIEMEDGRRVVVDNPATGADGSDKVNDAFDGGRPLSFGTIIGIRIYTDASFGATGSGGTLAQRKRLFELAVMLNGESRWFDCSFYVKRNGTGYNEKRVFEIKTPDGLAQLGQVLTENRLYYSQQIWRRQNPQTMIMQLAQFKMTLGSKTINLVDHINPVPVKFVGNFAVYKFSYEEDNDWRIWVHKNIDKSSVVSDLVAIPTGGVFAEAVQGRFNSAEKIDATRFFNWQDSPPDPPPAIAPLKAGERMDLAEVPKVPDFENSVVRLQAPQAFPDPTGLSSALSAIVAADVFRNMSGAAATGAAGEAAAGAASEASVDALARAGSAFAKTLSTLGNAFGVLGSSDGLKSLSSLGALFNEKKKMQEQASAEEESAPESGGPGPGGTAGGNGGGAPSPASEIVDGAIEGTFVEDIFDGPDPGGGAEETEAAQISTGDDFPPVPQLFGERLAAMDHPPLGLLSIYLSQYEGDDRIPDSADDLFRWNIVQSLGQQLRHHHLARHRETGEFVSSQWLYQKAMALTNNDSFLALLLCHNHTRSLGLREGNLAYEAMALPWSKVSGDENSVKYKFGVFTDNTRKQMKEYPFEIFRSGEPDHIYKITVRGKNSLVKTPSGFYLLHDPNELGPDAPNDWYHFFLNQLVTAGFSSNRIDDAIGIEMSQLASIAMAVYNSDDRTATLKERMKPVFWTFVLYYVIRWLAHLLRRANPGATPDNNHYKGWLWMNAMSFMEGLFYESESEQEDSTRESHLHRMGALTGILRIVDFNSIAADGSRPTWRWYVPKAKDLRAKVDPILVRLEAHLSNFELFDAISDLSSLDDELGTLAETIGPYVHEILDVEGNVLQSGALDQGEQSVSALARAILISDRITLSDIHSSGNDDNATALQNISDMADGNQAALSSYGNAPGGSVMLSVSLLEGILAIAERYTINISELAGGSHSPTSRHYVGVAADINEVNGEHVSSLSASVVGDFKQLAQNLGATEVLGPGDDPHHQSHFHVAWPRPV